MVGHWLIGCFRAMGLSAARLKFLVAFFYFLKRGATWYLCHYGVVENCVMAGCRFVFGM